MFEFKFNTGITCDFITPVLDTVETPLVALYDVSPSGIEIIRVVPYHLPPTRFTYALCDLLNLLQDFDHLIWDIEQFIESESEQAEGEMLFDQKQSYY